MKFLNCYYKQVLLFILTIIIIIIVEKINHHNILKFGLTTIIPGQPSQTQVQITKKSKKNKK